MASSYHSLLLHRLSAILVPWSYHNTDSQHLSTEFQIVFGMVTYLLMGHWPITTTASDRSPRWMHQFPFRLRFHRIQWKFKYKKSKNLKITSPLFCCCRAAHLMWESYRQIPNYNGIHKWLRIAGVIINFIFLKLPDLSTKNIAYSSVLNINARRRGFIWSFRIFSWWIIA